MYLLVHFAQLVAVENERFGFADHDRKDLKNLFLQLDNWDKEYHLKFLPKAGTMRIAFYENRLVLFVHLE